MEDLTYWDKVAADNVSILIADEHIMELASRVDLAISFWSSAALDCSLLGLPVIEFFDPFNSKKSVSGGCSGLSYKMGFDNESQPNDQIFEDNGLKVVTDLKSFLYLCNTTLEFSGGLNGKGFYFNNPNASRECGCGESFAV